MAEEQPIVPPLRKPVSQFTTPVQIDAFYVELVNRDDPAYKDQAPVKRGTLYSTMIGAKPEVVTAYPNLYFLKEVKYQQSDQLVQWYWATDRSAESSFNAEISYALESVTSPTYARTYTIRRDVYDNLEPIAEGTPITGIIGVYIENPGSGYTYATGIIDTGATVEFVCSEGQIVSGIVTNEGSDVTDGAEIYITGDGTGAEADAIIQPASAVLVGQKKAEFPDDSPLRNEYVQVTRIYQTLPGPTIHSTEIEVDGGVVDVATTQKVASTITSGETLVGTTWSMTTKVQEDNVYIGKEVLRTRTVPGNPIKSTSIDSAGDITTETRTLVAGPPTLVTTITTAGGVWTKTFAEPLSIRLTLGEEASDLVSWKVVQNKLTQNTMDSYEVSIPDLIPIEFRATLPLTTHEDTLIGVASLPTLATGDLLRKQDQIDFNTYRLTVSGRAGITLPQTLTNKELTSQFGGGTLNVVMKLNTSGSDSIEEGLTVVSSEIKNLGNGLQVRTTKTLDDTAWPSLPSRLWDEKTRQEYDETEQVVDSGSSEDSNPGVFAWVSEVKALDKWRSQRVNTSKDAPLYVDEGSALITYEFKPFKFPGLLTPATFGYYVRSSYAELIQHTVRTWWVQSVPTPTVTVEDLIPDTIIISTLNDITSLAYSGMVLHDDLTTFGVLFWPATTPSYTTYLTSWQGFEKVIAATITPEREKDVWKIQTESVVMR